MLTFTQWLEMSYTDADIPQYFYLCCKLTPDLLTGQLTGLQGVADNLHVTRLFWTQVLLRMPARQLLQVNRLSRIMYDNPNYMVSKNLNPVTRVKHDAGAMLRIADFMHKVHDSDRYLKNAFGNFGLDGQIHLKLVKNMEKMPVNNLGDYIRVLYYTLNELGITDGNGQPLKPNAKSFDYFSKYFAGESGYKKEGEWMVKPSYVKMLNMVKQLPILTIPQGTIAIVREKAWKKRPDLVEKLGKKYPTYLIEGKAGLNGESLSRRMFDLIDTGRIQPNQPFDISTIRRKTLEV